MTTQLPPAPQADPRETARWLLREDGKSYWRASTGGHQGGWVDQPDPWPLKRDQALRELLDVYNGPIKWILQEVTPLGKGMGVVETVVEVLQKPTEAGLGFLTSDVFGRALEHRPGLNMARSFVVNNVPFDKLIFDKLRSQYVPPAKAPKSQSEPQSQSQSQSQPQPQAPSTSSDLPPSSDLSTVQIATPTQPEQSELIDHFNAMAERRAARWEQQGWSDSDNQTQTAVDRQEHRERTGIEVA